MSKKFTMKTLVKLLGEHLCTVNILLGPVTVHYREDSLNVYRHPWLSRSVEPSVCHCCSTSLWVCSPFKQDELTKPKCDVALQTEVEVTDVALQTEVDVTESSIQTQEVVTSDTETQTDGRTSDMKSSQTELVTSMHQFVQTDGHMTGEGQSFSVSSLTQSHPDQPLAAIYDLPRSAISGQRAPVYTELMFLWFQLVFNIFSIIG